MNHKLKTPLHKKLFRILSKGWYTREQLAETMYTSEHQVTCMTTLFRDKGITVLTRPSREKPGYKEYSIGDKDDPLGIEFESRSVQAGKDMLIVEMNRIRIEAKDCGNKTIQYMASRALQACGVNTEEVKLTNMNYHQPKYPNPP